MGSPFGEHISCVARDLKSWSASRFRNLDKKIAKVEASI